MSTTFREGGRSMNRGTPWSVKDTNATRLRSFDGMRYGRRKKKSRDFFFRLPYRIPSNERSRVAFVSLTDQGVPRFIDLPPSRNVVLIDANRPALLHRARERRDAHVLEGKCVRQSGDEAERVRLSRPLRS